MVYIIAEKISDIREPRTFNYGYRCYYQPSADDAYLIDPINFNSPNGVTIYGFGPDILKKKWEDVLGDVFKNIHADITVAALVSFIYLFKSNLNINNKIYKFSDVVKVLDSCVKLQSEPVASGITASGEVAHHSV